MKHFYKRAIALIADTHIGSKYALFPEVFVSQNAEGDVEVRANKGQKEILGYWRYFCGRVWDYWNVDTILHLGDAVDGPQSKARDTLCLASMEDQRDCFDQTIHPYIKRRQFFDVSGTPYHGSIDTQIHKSIAKDLGGRYLGIIRNINIKGTGLRINLAHSINPSIYIGGALDKQGVFISLAEAARKLPKVDVVLRGHIHTFMHIHTGTKHLCILPGWKAFEPYKPMLANYGKMQPDIGGAILLIDDSNRVTIHHYLLDRIPHILDAEGYI